MNKTLATLSVLAAGILWGIIGLFVRRLNAVGFASMEIVFMRALSGMLIMGVFILLYDRKLFKIRLKDIWCFVGTGIISLTLFNLCYFATMSMTSLSVAAILLYTAPSMVMVLSFFIFKEKFSTKKIVSVILAFLGCVLVTGVFGLDAALPLAGILTGLGSGLGYALYSIFARFALNKEYHSFTITFYTLVFSAIGTIWFFTPSKFVNLVQGNEGIILLVLMLGLISTTFPYIFYTLGLKGLESGKASIIASIEPVTATVLGVLIFHESMSVSGIAGAIIVLLSIIIVNI